MKNLKIYAVLLLKYTNFLKDAFIELLFSL